MRNITLQPISVLIDGGSHEGRLVFADADLVAVFVQVTAEESVGAEAHAGDWFLEAGFGPCGVLATTSQPAFATLEEAEEWVRRRLETSPSLPGA
jgi:hypothetical protein